MNSSAVITLIVFAFVVVSFVMQKISSTKTIAIAIAVLWATNVLTMQEVFANFTGNAVVILVSMMIVSGGFMKTNILTHIVNLVTKFNKGGERVVIAAALLITFVLANFMNAVAAMICLVPLLMGLAEKTGISRTKLVEVANTGALFGVSMFPVGLGITTYTMKNAIIENLGCDARFGVWDVCLVRLVPVAVCMIYIIFFGYKLLPDKPSRAYDDSSFGTTTIQKSTLSPVKEKIAYAIFILVIVGMLLSQLLGISAAMVAFIGAILMSLSGVLDSKETFQKVHWPTVFLLGFVLAFATALTKSGAGDLLASLITKILGGKPSIYLVVAVYFFVTCIATQLMDNTAIINIMGPLAVMTCMSLDMSPLAAVGVIDLAGLTAIATPLGAPSTAVAFNMGGYKITDLIKYSLPIIIIMGIVATIVTPMMFPA